MIAIRPNPTPPCDCLSVPMEMYAHRSGHRYKVVTRRIRSSRGFDDLWWLITTPPAGTTNRAMDSYHTLKSGPFQPPISVPTTAVLSYLLSVVYKRARAWSSVKGNTRTRVCEKPGAETRRAELGNSRLDTTTRARRGTGQER